MLIFMTTSFLGFRRSVTVVGSTRKLNSSANITGDGAQDSNECSLSLKISDWSRNSNDFCLTVQKLLLWLYVGFLSRKVPPVLLPFSVLLIPLVIPEILVFLTLKLLPWATPESSTCWGSLAKRILHVDTSRLSESFRLIRWHEWAILLPMRLIESIRTWVDSIFYRLYAPLLRRRIRRW